MRTILIGRKHGSKTFELICGPEVKTTEQINRRTELSNGHPVSPIWAELEMWHESPAKGRLRFLSPKDAKTKSEASEKEAADFAASQKARAEAIAKGDASEADKRAKAHAAEVEDKNKRLAGALSTIPKRD